jgi:hypothetical protein
METYSALLVRQDPSTSRSLVFLTPYEKGWRLPALLPQSDIHNTDAGIANLLALEQLGIAVVTRQALRVMEPALPGPLNIYIMEPRHDVELSSPTVPGRWFAPDAWQALSFVLPQERAVLAAWCAQASEETIPTLSLPWWRDGWFETTVGWLHSEVERLGKTVLAPVEQLRSNYTSAILRVRTDAGALYLKQVPAAFAFEPTLTQLLARQYSAHIPQVLVATQDRLLLSDLGDHWSPGRETPLERWEAILRFYGQMQVESVTSVSQWLSLGCADLRLEPLGAQLEELCARVPERLHGLPQQLDAEELARLRALTAPLQALCAELAAYGVPDALEHGDLHAGNVALTTESFRLYDWSHACVTFPFYGFGDLLLDDDWFANDSEVLSRLRDAYLESWTAFAPLPQLRAAFTLWRRLRPLFMAAHQSYVVSAYHRMLNGCDYLPETATGNALQHMQWWLAQHWRTLLQGFAEEGRASTIQ